MFEKIFFVFIFIYFSGLFAQETNTKFSVKKTIATKDTIQIEKFSLNSNYLRILDRQNQVIDSSFYKINFQKGFLIFNEKFTYLNDSISILYQKLPDFLTKEYSIYDTNRVVTNTSEDNNLYKVSNDGIKKFIPFDGLTTSGSITRGITIGNNQNSVVNSNLDLKITGKISDKVSLRASIQDSNIPLRNGGYSQKLDEFDQIFIELFSDKWSLRAGDLFLENRKSRFLNFNKKVQGLSANFSFGTSENKTTVFASAAIVKGKYAKSNFTGQEGNQGPYKLLGQNGELYILVISGTENVFVNGILLKRGENKDYIIDYNAGEIKFTSLFPITSEMRIVIEYQYTDRNYTSFVTYTGAAHEGKNWSLGGYLYSETDLKNQSLQQNLSEEQAQILVHAGDNQSLMVAESAFLDSYSENKTLYKKTIVGSVSYFEYSNVSTDVLYNVRFSLVGNNAGNYILSNASAIGKIYQYIAPIAGILQGNYEPIIKLIAPTKIQIATILGKFNPTEKTAVDFELGISNNDNNLFSSIDDNDNQGVAGKINFKQRLFSKKMNIDAFGNYQFIQKNFRTIERLFAIEFNRDWNLTQFFGNQSYLISGLDFILPENGKFTYQFEKLDFSESFSGNRHVFEGFLKYKNVRFQNQGSYLKSDGTYSKSQFFRNQSQLRFHYNKNWIGLSLRIENNQEKLKETNQFSGLSQRFLEYGGSVGRGDSTKVFVELGYLNRVNDSLQSGFIKRVNQSNSYYIKSKLIQSDRRDLSIFVNYRTLQFQNPLTKNENSLNSRLLYNDRFFDNFIQSTTSFETSSGSIAQQEFTYLEVAPGLGVYTWKDYNGNGIQELQEFEVAPFQDQAKFVRVYLPNQIFIKTHQNRLSQSVIINPINWQNKTGFKKICSYFYNQTSFLMERKILRNSDNFDLNPFRNSSDVLGLNSSFRNSFFYNRGKQNHSVTYTFLNNKSKNLLSVGALENKINSHQLQYVHLVNNTWLFSLNSKLTKSATISENYATRNYNITGNEIQPKLGYLFTKNASLDVFYEFQKKENTIGTFENLKQTRFGTSFSYISTKDFTTNGEFSLIDNKFVGDELSPVAFQMLEGLQAGKNLTWRLLLQKNLTKYLSLNINYQGRKSETSQTIHTGSVQLKAFF